MGVFYPEPRFSDFGDFDPPVGGGRVRNARIHAGPCNRTRANTGKYV